MKYHFVKDLLSIDSFVLKFSIMLRFKTSTTLTSIRNPHQKQLDAAWYFLLKKIKKNEIKIQEISEN